MPVIRVEHDKEKPYVQLHKESLWDPNLSWKAVGLWARCLSRPNDWEFNVAEMIKSSKEGKHALYTTLDELTEYNYVVRLKVQKRNEEGKYLFHDTVYTFFEKPQTEQQKLEYLERFKQEELKKCFPLPGFQDAENQDPENPPLLIKIYTKKEENNINKKDLPDSQPSEPPPHPKPEPLDDDVNLQNGIRETFDALPKAERKQIIALYRKQKKVDNPEGWFTDCMKEKWHLKTFDPPKEDEPECVANRRDNIAFSERLIKALEPRKDVHISLLTDFLQFGLHGHQRTTVSLSENPYAFSQHVKKTFKLSKVDVDFYLTSLDKENKEGK